MGEVKLIRVLPPGFNNGSCQDGVEYTKAYSTQCEHVSVLLTHKLYFITSHACHHDVCHTPCCHKPPQR